jgi:hypothetical protein
VLSCIHLCNREVVQVVLNGQHCRVYAEAICCYAYDGDKDSFAAILRLLQQLGWC